MSDPTKHSPADAPGFSRRSFLKGAGVAAAGAAMISPGVAGALEPPAAAGIDGLREAGSGPVAMSLKINGTRTAVTAEPRATLLSVLREKLDLTGPKEICDRGACGGCSVLLDGVAVNSCMMLAIDAEGREIVTIEGIAADPKRDKLVDAFCACDAAQCGYCIPGFVVRSAALLDEIPHPSREQIKEGLSGNICRCGTYTKIFEAVEMAAK